MKRYRLKRHFKKYKAGTIIKESKYNQYTFVYYDYMNGISCYLIFPRNANISEWLEEVGERWRPKEGDTFFYTRLEDVIEVEWPDEEEVTLYNLEEKYLDTYNCFRTREQAEECAKLCLETRKKYTESLNQG